MQLDFHSEYENVKNLHEQGNLPWKRLEDGLNRLKKFAREKHQQDEANALEDIIKSERLDKFEDAFQEAEAKLQNGEIKNISQLNEVVNHLQEMAEPNLPAVVNRIHEFRERWRNVGRIKKLRQDVYNYLENYKQAILGGTSPEDAAKQFLEPAEKLIATTMLEMGESPETTRLLSDVRKAIKDADQSAKITNAVTARFKVLIDDLEVDTSGQPHIVYDMNGKVRGTYSRAEAIEFYISEAEKYAVEKADEYLAKAQRYVDRGEYPLANYILDAVAGLYQLPDDKKDEVQQFRERHIYPAQQRINNAREKLKSVRNAPNLEIALQYFEEALSPQHGWPDFENLEKQRENAKDLLKHEFQDDGGSGESSLVGDARTYLYTAMENKLQRWQGQESGFTEGHKLLFQVTEDQVMDLEDYLTWGDGRLGAVFGRIFNQLKENFYRQLREQQGLLDAANNARAAIQRNNFKAAFDALHPYAKVLDNERESYREAYDLWVEAQAIHGIWQIKEEVDVAVQSRFQSDPHLLSQEINRLRRVSQKAQDAQEKNPTGANSTGLNRAVRELQTMLGLISALQAQSQGKIAEAIGYLRPIAKATDSPFFLEIKALLEELEGLIIGGEAITSAIEQAEIARTKGDLRAAYQILKQQEDKFNYDGHAELMRLLAEIKYELGEEVKAEIAENLEQMPQNPASLEKLAALLKELNPLAYDAAEPEIVAALNIQKAMVAYVQAEGKQDVILWRKALNAWRLVNDPNYQETQSTVQEAYTIAFCNAELTASNNPSENLEPSRVKLRQALSAIDDLNQLGMSVRQTSLLKAQIWMRLAELEDAPHHVRNALLSLIHAMNECTEEMRQSAVYVQTKWRLDRAGDLCSVAESLETAAKQDTSLEEWQAILKLWDEAAEGVAEFHLGLAQWRKQRIDTIAINLEKIIQEAKEVWQKAEPMAILYLFGRQLEERALKQQYLSLKTLIEQAIKDFGGDAASHVSAESEYFTRLNRAGRAMCFIYQRLERETLKDYGQELEDLNNLLRALELKILELGEVYQVLARARERLTAACANGNFAAVEKEMARITAPDAAYGEYRQHQLVKQLLQQIEADKKERNRLLLMAQEINQLLTIEQFYAAQQKLPLLMADAGKRYLASQMAEMVDEFAENEVLNFCIDIQERVEEKIEEVENLIQWLAPVIERAKMLALVRPTDTQLPLGQPPLNLALTRIVNFEQAEAQKIEPFRSQRQYIDALEELDELEFGGVSDENNPAQNYRGGNLLSLEQAFNCLQTPPYEEEQKLHSRLAVAIFRWAVTLWDYLSQRFDYIETLREDLILSDREFPKERDRFFDAYNNLKHNVGNRRENLKLLKQSYEYIRGEGVNIIGMIERNGIYPLAHNWNGLDQQYKEFSADIVRQGL